MTLEEETYGCTRAVLDSTRRKKSARALSAGSVIVFPGEPYDPHLWRYSVEIDSSAVGDNLVKAPNPIPATFSTGGGSYGWFTSWASDWTPIFREDQEHHVIAVAKRSGKGLYLATCMTVGGTSLGTDLLENIITSSSQIARWLVP